MCVHRNVLTEVIPLEVKMFPSKSQIFSHKKFRTKEEKQPSQLVFREVQETLWNNIDYCCFYQMSPRIKCKALLLKKPNNSDTRLGEMGYWSESILPQEFLTVLEQKIPAVKEEEQLAVLILNNCLRVSIAAAKCYDHGAKPLLLCRTPSILHLQLSLWLHFH